MFIHLSVPLKQQSVTVIERGTDHLYLSWVDPHNYTYQGHEIGYRRHDSTALELRNGSNDMTFDLGGLDPGYLYDIYVVAVTAGVKSQPSETLTTPTCES